MCSLVSSGLCYSVAAQRFCALLELSLVRLEPRSHSLHGSCYLQLICFSLICRLIVFVVAVAVAVAVTAKRSLVRVEMVVACYCCSVAS